jgi:DNA-directed RNA polymerase subunit M/transcription elongation factor TFIIS
MIAVLSSWHKENCGSELLYQAKDDTVIVCGECGRYIQAEKTSTIAKEV